MGNIRVVTDSSCDLPQGLADEHDIEIVPLTIRFGDEELVDRRDLTPKEFWAKCAATPVLPETAAPSPGAFETAFRKAAADGCAGVVCICLSGDLSATYQSAQLAAQAVEGEIPVRVIDSKSITMGLGVMCLSAAAMAEQGKGIDDVAAAAEDLVPRVRVYGALNTLENLKKGGRIGGAKALAGSLLSIKPIIEVRNGKVEEESKQRTRARSLRYLADKIKAAGDLEYLAVMHGEAADLDEFLEMLASVPQRDDMVIGDIGAVIGTHGGPGVMGVAFVIPA
jgi:DegV family protein with EDD domain